MYKTISPEELSKRLQEPEGFKFIDVREPAEYEMARLDKAELMPLSRFNDWIDSLNKEDEIVVMCHHGIRSANLCMFLIRNGFEKVFNLEGGIDLWSKEVDFDIPRY